MHKFNRECDLLWYRKEKRRIDDLQDSVALWWAYEKALNPDESTFRVSYGSLVIYLNDDVNPPGFYFFAKPTHLSLEQVKDFIKSRLGEEVYVPWEALYSTVEPKYTTFRSRG